MSINRPTEPLTMSGWCAFPTNFGSHEYCSNPNCTCSCHEERNR